MATLEQRMVLHHFMCQQFGYSDLRKMLEYLNNFQGGSAEVAGSQYAQALDLNPQVRPESKASLTDYDSNITACSRALGMTPDKGRIWKPFQYLALLFTERYLDRYFQNPHLLLKNLNQMISLSYRGMGFYTPDDLRTLAFQSATGSGKTLLLHANILQYQHYLRRHRLLHKLNRVILLTPDEGLSRQHLAELTASGIPARLFADNSRQGLLSTGDFVVDIIDLHKLADRKGVKRVALESFEDNNLILVDEGHLGVSGRTWRANRKRLALNGFTFEYSATFNQAVAGNGQGVEQLRNEYGKAILFDYSYKYFYEDGYGKDYRITNLQQSDDGEANNLYLLACLLTFYQQCKIYGDKGWQWRDFNIAPPLWVFLGKTVSGGNDHVTPDVVKIVNFLGWVLGEAAQVERDIEGLISGDTGLTDKNGRDVFANSFDYITTEGQTPQEIYDGLCKSVFRNRGALQVSHLTGTDELQLSAGNTEPFGVINVGDAARLYNTFDRTGDGHDRPYTLTKDAFRKPLFAEVDNDSSPITLVIGARKFAAGWNSWRVSTMGLMHVGVGEGPQIIQMFGRGVRLKGYDMSLKRHNKVNAGDIPDSKLLALLETLNIFGLKANYMDKFKDYLHKADITGQVSFEVNVKKQLAGTKGLKILQTKRNTKAYEFSDQRLDLPAKLPGQDPVVLDLRRNLQVLNPGGDEVEGEAGIEEHSKLEHAQLQLINKHSVYHKVLQRKQQSGWHNLGISQDTVNALLDAGNANWYTLYIPPEKLRASTYDRTLDDWEGIATELVCEYAKQYWRRQRTEWERKHIEAIPLPKDHPNFIDKHKVTIAAIEKSDEEMAKLVDEIQQRATELDLANDKNRIPAEIKVPGGQLSLFKPDFHAFIPLIHVSPKAAVSVSPVALNTDEQKFVNILDYFIRKGDEVLAGKQLYLMRNLGKGKGVSFFDNQAFYPDFILWITDAVRQDILFIDPKGLSIYNSKQQSKVNLHKEIKHIERDIRKKIPNLHLHAYIWSHTNPQSIGSDKKLGIDEWRKLGVYFSDNGISELKRLLEQALSCD